MKELIIIKYGELSTKKKNIKFFITTPVSMALKIHKINKETFGLVIHTHIEQMHTRAQVITVPTILMVQME